MRFKRERSVQKEREPSSGNMLLPEEIVPEDTRLTILRERMDRYERETLTEDGDETE